MRILILFLFFIFTQSLSAQFNAGNGLEFIGAGFNWSYAEPDGLNTIIDRYNATQNLSTPMAKMTPDGWSFSLQLASVTDRSVGSLDFGYINQKGTTSALLANGIRQELQLKSGVFYMGYGARLLKSTGFRFSVGSRMEFGSIKVKERRALEVNIHEAEWNETNDDFILNLTLYTKINLPFVLFEPYYCLGLERVVNWAFSEDKPLIDLQDMNQTLNPGAVYQQSDRLPLNMSGFGIRLLFGFSSLGEF